MSGGELRGEGVGGAHLVDEEDAGDQLRHALVNIPVHDLVNLLPQLVRNLSLLRLHQLAHHAHDILPALRPRIRYVEVMQRHILHNLLLLMHIPLWHGHVLLRLEVEFRGVGVRAADPLAGARVGFNVDDVADRDALLLYGLVDGGVEAQLLGAFAGLEPDEEVADGPSVAAEWVLRFLGCELNDLALVHLLCLPHAQT